MSDSSGPDEAGRSSRGAAGADSGNIYCTTFADEPARRTRCDVITPSNGRANRYSTSEATACEAASAGTYHSEARTSFNETARK